MKTIILFELKYLMRRPATWIYFALLFALAFLFMSTDAITLGGGVGKVFKNSPYVIAQASVILTLIGSIITTALAGTAILRDFEIGIHSLYFTKPLTKAQYVVGRFVGACIVMMFVYLALPLGLMIGSLMPWLEADKLGPFSILAFFQPYVVFIVPTMLFVSALFFTVGTLTRSMFAVYVQGIALFIAYAIAGTITRSLDNTHISSVLDPYGIRSFFFETRYWTVFEKNTMFVPLGEYVLLNRLVWLSVAVILFALGYFLFSFDVQPLRLRSKKKVAEQEEEPVLTSQLVIPAATQDFTSHFGWRSFLALTRMYVRSVMKDILFLALSVIGMVNTLFALYNADRIFGTSVYPTTYLMLETLNAFTFFILLISTFYGGELVWRERRFRAHQIVDALAVPSWSSYVAKIVALILAQMSVVAVLNLAGILMQLSKGYTNIEFDLYLFDYITGSLPRVAFFSLFAISVHTVVNNKYIGHFATVFLWIGVIALPALKLDHILYQFLSTAEGTYSAMNGFGPFMPRHVALTVYWLFVCTTLSWCAYLVYVRGTEESMKVRLSKIRERLTRPAIAFGSVAILASFSAGGFIFYNTNILNKRVTEEQGRHQSRLYEERYRHFLSQAQPHIIATKINLDLMPEERRYSANGSFTLINNYSTPIDTILVALNDDNEYQELRFDREYQEVVRDSETNVRLMRLKVPLAPHDSCVFSFSMTYVPHGFGNGALNTSMTYNGTFLNNDIFPIIGYNANYELGEEDSRKKEGLKERERMPNINDERARMSNYISSNTDWMRYEIIVSTAPDQIAVSPGYIQKEWTSNNRRYFHYKMDAPILGFFSILSARYETRRELVDGINVEIYYQKGHEYNLDRMVSSIKKSLAYFGKNFSPYQFRQVRILEFPRYADFAQSFPNTIPYSEGIGFIARIKSEEDVDYPFYVTSHEIAHQWWGHQVVGAGVQGATMLSESFAEYSALMVMKHEYGEAKMKKFLRFSLNDYLRGRSSERRKELPLMLNENQQYIHYNKGSLVLYALADYIGEDSVNKALSRFCQRYRFAQPPYPTTLDFISELRKVIPDSLNYIIHEWFETITLYDNRIKEAKYTQRPDGKYDVTLVLESHKMLMDSLGVPTNLPVHDLIDVGVFDEHENPLTKLGSALYVQKHRIDQGRTTMHFTVNSKPAKAGIDPYNKLIDRDAEDNVMTVDKN